MSTDHPDQWVLPEGGGSFDSKDDALRKTLSCLSSSIRFGLKESDQDIIEGQLWDTDEYPDGEKTSLIDWRLKRLDRIPGICDKLIAYIDFIEKKEG